MSCVVVPPFQSFGTIFPDFPFKIIPQTPKIAGTLKVPIIMHFLRKVKEVVEYFKVFFLSCVFIYNTCR
jgi:hypothetical protein